MIEKFVQRLLPRQYLAVGMPKCTAIVRVQLVDSRDQSFSLRTEVAENYLIFVYIMGNSSNASGVQLRWKARIDE